jgi:hypothetical protein
MDNDYYDYGSKSFKKIIILAHKGVFQDFTKMVEKVVQNSESVVKNLDLDPKNRGFIAQKEPKNPKKSVKKAIKKSPQTTLF